MANYPSLLNISTNNMPILTRYNFIEWKDIINDVLAPYTGAVEILHGDYAPGSKMYSLRTDRQLLSLIHRLVSSEIRPQIRVATQELHTPVCEVWQMLNDLYEDVSIISCKKILQAEAEIFKQDSGEDFISYYSRFRELVTRFDELSYYTLIDTDLLNEKQKIEVFTNGLLTADKDRAIALINAGYGSGLAGENIFTNWEQVAKLFL